MRIALISDIHGNLHALEAVLAAIKTLSPDLILDLGDCVSGPLYPRETYDLLTSLKFPTVRGNHDRAVGTSPREGMPRTDSFAYDRLDDAARARLAALPMRLNPIDGVLAFHATPEADEPYFMEEVASGRLVLKHRRDIESVLGTKHWAPLIVVGHSHQARVVHVPAPDGTTTMIVNPGSVGYPAYLDDSMDSTPPHVCESGSPHAKFAILTRRGKTWVPEFRMAEYDWAAASRLAGKNGRPDWEMGLMTGFLS